MRGPDETQRPCMGHGCKGGIAGDAGLCEECHERAVLAGEHAGACDCAPCMWFWRTFGGRQPSGLLPPPPPAPVPPVLPGCLPEVQGYLRAAPERARSAAYLLGTGAREGLCEVLDEAVTKRRGCWPEVVVFVAAWLAHGPEAADLAWNRACPACSAAVVRDGARAKLCPECRAEEDGIAESVLDRETAHCFPLAI